MQRNLAFKGLNLSGMRPIAFQSRWTRASRKREICESSSRAYNKLLLRHWQQSCRNTFQSLLAVMPAIELTLRNGEPSNAQC